MSPLRPVPNLTSFVLAASSLRINMILLLVPFFLSEVVSFTIETKLDLPNPTFFRGQNGQLISIDSSLSPKIVKAFFEINFIPVSKPDINRPFASVSSSKGCPYSAELCKYYFVPNKISTIQRIDDMIELAKKDSDVPVIEGLVVSDEEKLLKELNSTIMSKVNKVVPMRKSGSDDVPVYRGTVNIDELLKKSEVAELPEYRPHWPEMKKNPCFQGSCYNRNPYHDSFPISGRL